MLFQLTTQDNILHNIMSLTIKDILVGFSETLITYLSNHYKFSKEEALSIINLDNIIITLSNKIKNKNKNNIDLLRNDANDANDANDTNDAIGKNTFILPFCGVVNKYTCNAIRLNYELYTQCTNKKIINSIYCKTCKSQADNNDTNEPNYGNIDSRLKCGVLDFVSVKGKKVIPYKKIMDKLNITRKEAENEAKKIGWVIDECQFTDVKVKRGRHKKIDNTIIDEEKTPSTRGRPKRDKKSVINGDDLIASLIQAAMNNLKSTDDPDSDSESSIDIEVSRISYNNKNYLLDSKNNDIYDIESNDHIGTWNNVKKEIIFFENS